MNKNIILLLFLSLILFSGTLHKPKYSPKKWGWAAYYFENENGFRNFFDFHKGNVVAEIGAYNGINMKGFSLVADSVTFYLQDIDTIVLSQKNFNKAVVRCKKLNPSNKFYRCIGTETQTNLPDNSFDKIFLITTVCVLSRFDEMIEDIYQKLNETGQLYILQSECLTKGHKNFTADEMTEMMKKHNLFLVKKDTQNTKWTTKVYKLVFRKQINN